MSCMLGSWDEYTKSRLSVYFAFLFSTINILLFDLTRFKCKKPSRGFCKKVLKTFVFWDFLQHRCFPCLLVPCPDLACRRLKASLNYLLCSIEICENLGEYLLLIMINVLVGQKNIVSTFDSDNGWEASPQVGGEREGRSRSGMTIVVLVLLQCTAVLGWSMLC